MKTVIVIGGGIAGLTCASKLDRDGVPVELYESSDRTGGMIGSFRRDGFLVEHGPSTLLQTTPRITKLVAELGLESRIVDPLRAMSRRYLVRDGKLQQVPNSVWRMARTSLLSPRGKLRAMFEPLARKGSGTVEETVAAFVKRRLGTEVLDYFVDALVGGIYAGDPHRLSVRHAFPKLHKLEQTYGSLTRGAILGASERAASGARSKLDATPIAFNDGMQVLVDAMAKGLAGHVHLQMDAERITTDADGYSVQFRTGVERRCSAVILCAPAHALSHIVFDSRGPQLGRLDGICYPPIGKVTLGFKRNQIRHALDGFGVLIPSIEKLHSLGILFSSSVYPGRAPDGSVVLSVFVGGARQPELCDRGEAGIRQIALADATHLLGIEGDPQFEDIRMIPHSIPQYEVGYAGAQTAMDTFEHDSPGLFLAGNYRGGISVADVVNSSLAKADEVKEYLSNVDSTSVRSTSAGSTSVSSAGHTADQYRVA